ncbi:MAG: MFS transporter [Alphaproteobacteria bacterium]
MTKGEARLALGFSCIAHTITHLMMLIYPVVVLSLEREFNQPYAELLPLAFAGFVLYGVAALPAGWLADRFSATAMMVVFYLGIGLSSIATGFADGPLGIAVGLGSVGLFAAIYHPVGIAWLVRHAESRGKALGFNGLFGSLGTAVAALVAASLTDLFGWRWAFIVPGLVACAVGGAFIVALGTGAIRETKVDRAPVEAPSRDDAVRASLILFGSMFVTGLLFQTLSVAMPKLFEQRIGEVLAQIGTIGVAGMVTIVYLISMGAHLLGGYLADRASAKTTYFVTYLLQVPTLFVAASIDSLLLVVVAALAVFWNVASTAPENVLLAHYTPAKWRATAYGAKFVLALGVGALGVPLVAAVHERTGDFVWTFWILGGLAILVTLIALWLPSAPTTKTAAASQPAK